MHYQETHSAQHYAERYPMLFVCGACGHEADAFVHGAYSHDRRQLDFKDGLTQHLQDTDLSSMKDGALRDANRSLKMVPCPSCRHVALPYWRYLSLPILLGSVYAILMSLLTYQQYWQGFDSDSWVLGLFWSVLLAFAAWGARRRYNWISAQSKVGFMPSR